jgi:hypothetical protein
MTVLDTSAAPTLEAARDYIHPPPFAGEGAIDTPAILARLADHGDAPLDASDVGDLNAICRELAVRGRLRCSYYAGRKPDPDAALLGPGDSARLIDVLVTYAERHGSSEEHERGLALKCLNAALSALDTDRPMIEPVGRSDLITRVQATLDRITLRMSAVGGASAQAEACGSLLSAGNNCSRTVLPLTVLAYEGPMARAYLAALRRAGYRPRRVLLIALSRHPATGRPVGRWLPVRFRMAWSQRTQALAQNYWPRRIRATHPWLADAIARGLEPICDDPADLIAEMYGAFRYQEYAEAVERVLAEGLGDDALSQALRRQAPGTVLFTGGGILPRKLLAIPGLRFVHVHPGRLPQVRGADGLLWSMLVRGRPGRSAFCMAPGIDTGDLIIAEDYPPIRFDLSNHRRPDDLTLYRAIFSFCDPILRADFLIRGVLRAGIDPATAGGAPQDISAGLTYHFMHERLREKVLAVLFRGGQSPAGAVQ